MRDLFRTPAFVGTPEQKQKQMEDYLAHLKEELEIILSPLLDKYDEDLKKGD